MQLQANFSQKSILRPQVTDTTAFGVAIGCLVGKGEINIEDMGKFWKLEKDFKADKNPYYAKKKTLWDQTIQRLYL
jgi:glycerol kinase